jgi:lysophospholipase L1-like esterase
MRVVCLGDSVTAGFGLGNAGEACCYVQLLADRAQRDGLALDLIPSALDGIDTRYALRRFSRMVTALDPDWVLIMLGLNDARPCGDREPTPVPEFQEHVIALLDRVVALPARPVLVAPNPRFAEQDGQRVELMGPYVDALRRVAGQFDLPWVNLYERFLAADDLPRLLPDGLHPGPWGHRLIAEVLAAEVACFWPSQAGQESTAEAESHAPLDHAGHRRT